MATPGSSFTRTPQGHEDNLGVRYHPRANTSQRYISGVLRSVALPLFRALRNPTFQQDNARPHVSGIVRAFLDTENVRLLSWSARSSDLSPIENVWSMAAQRLTPHHTPSFTGISLWVCQKHFSGVLENGQTNSTHTSCTVFILHKHVPASNKFLSVSC
ncbi:transposable element Tcb1 transposase [Trichonephila clavipes]|uniref:Transposable element Tcb1 transposase n=1 Tax=Trichonephila clavipes TaxID=2585209 RepID=A0A8X6RV94_TRICX|nr:transposable element Tcb1 transposase [Trichonephila clavipes]